MNSSPHLQSVLNHHHSNNFISFGRKLLSVLYTQRLQNYTDFSHPFSDPVTGTYSHYQKKLDIDLSRISKRVNFIFFPESHYYRDGTKEGPFESIYFVHLILFLGLVIGLIYLLLALIYFPMQRIRAYLPSLPKLRRRKKKGKGKWDIENPKKATPTKEEMEELRQQRLQMLQKEVDHLEEQLNTEKTTSLTSRASDSDLEYLAYLDDQTPPLKRNSISLQDIPQSVIKIRREKQLRQLKEEIEHLHALSQSSLDKIASPLLKDIEFDFQPSPSSPSPSPQGDPEHLSQRISHLKAQRKLMEIRTDLEDLALHLFHYEDIKAKTSSLQDIPKSALDIKRQEGLFSLAKEVEHVKQYKMKEKKSILETVFLDDKELRHKEKNEILAKLNAARKGAESPSKVPLLQREESQVSSASTTALDMIGCRTPPTPRLEPSPSIKRMRAQELKRVRVELLELSHNLNMNMALHHFVDQGGGEDDEF